MIQKVPPPLPSTKLHYVPVNINYSFDTIMHKEHPVITFASFHKQTQIQQLKATIGQSLKKLLNESISIQECSRSG